MSGGHFDYIQHRFDWQIIEPIQNLVDKNGKEKSEEDLKEESLYRDKEWYERYPEDKFYRKYPDDVIEEFKKGIYYLKMARIYTQRIDWLLSGDDGVDCFRRRLKEDIENLNK